MFLEFGNVEQVADRDTVTNEGLLPGRGADEVPPTIGQVWGDMHSIVRVRFADSPVEEDQMLHLPFAEPRIYSIVGQ